MWRFLTHMIFSKLLDPQDILQTARPRGYFLKSPNCSTQRIFFKTFALENAGARSVFVYDGCYQLSMLSVISPSLFVFATDFCAIVPRRVFRCFL